ncbi:MAG: queuosine precursor transporter [Candidatus Dependentiae bacterium]
MNELYFILHSCILALASLGALKLGKEALITFIAIQTVLANLFVTKQIILCGLNATAADPFIIGSALSLNLLQEYFGKPSALRAIVITFFVLACFGVFSYLHLLYYPSCYDTSQTHFEALLGITPRLVVASFAVYLIVSYLDTRLYALLKKRLFSIPAAFRNGFCVAITQAVDTILFTLIGLSGILSSLIELMIVSYGVKILCIAIALPFISLAKKIVPLPTTAQ